MELGRYTSAKNIIEDTCEIGRRAPISTSQPSPEHCEHVARLLRSGVTNGIGLRWCLRKPVGMRFDQGQLNEIAAQLEEGYCSGSAPNWRIEIRAETAPMHIGN